MKTRKSRTATVVLAAIGCAALFNQQKTAWKLSSLRGQVLDRVSMPAGTCSTRTDAPAVWHAVLATGRLPMDVCLNRRSLSTEELQGAKVSEMVVLPSVLVQTAPTDCSEIQLKNREGKSISIDPHGDPKQQQQQPRSQRSETCSPLSISFIIHDDPSTPSPEGADTFPSVTLDPESPIRSPSYSLSKTGVAKQKCIEQRHADYSHRSMVRHGRWTVEEENYAKAMIEAFKSAHLPLHGNVSLRKLLAEVLVCHPMRVSKKFVGSVHRKYNWYRMTADKCDSEVKRRTLLQLSRLERVFWLSVRRNNDWVPPDFCR